MPFAGPETALASTIDPEVESKIVRGKTTRPAACQNASTTFQRLPPRLNDLGNQDENHDAHATPARRLAFKPVTVVSRRIARRMF